MTKTGLKEHVKKMYTRSGITSTAGKRRASEMLYYLHYKDEGVRLRGKYRP